MLSRPSEPMTYILAVERSVKHSLDTIAIRRELREIRDRLFTLANIMVGFKAKVTQLTGFSDPVYAEAYVNVNQYHKTLKKYSDCLQDTAMNPSSSSLVGAGVVGAGQPSPSLPSAGVKPSGQQP